MKLIYPILAVLAYTPISAHAEQFGLFTYEIVDGEVTITDYPENAIGHVNIPLKIQSYPVTSIGNGAFTGCEGLTSITLPEGLRTISGLAFFRCAGLTAVSIPSSVLSIGDFAFSDCTELKSIDVATSNPNYTSEEGILFSSQMDELIKYPENRSGAYNIPSSVTSIASSAFANSIELTGISIPPSITAVSEFAFYQCASLTDISIPSSVTSIGNSAFSGCSGLADIVVPSTVTSMGDSVFFGCRDLTSISIPSNLTSIGDSVFYGCSSLTNISIPSNLSSIGNSAFSHCSGLTSLTIPSNVTQIGRFAFAYCSGLNFVMIPENLTTIGWAVFSGCRGLTTITIPDGVTSIGTDAFSGTSLSTVTLPPKLESLSIRAFSYCQSLKEIKVAATNSHFVSIGGVLYDRSGTTLVIFPPGKAGDYTVPEGVVRFSPTEHGYASVFGVFDGCEQLTKVTLPASLSELDAPIFVGCSRLLSIEVAAANPQFISDDGVLFNRGKTSLLRYPPGKPGAYRIPSGITSTANWNRGPWDAFEGSHRLERIEIPPSLTNLHDRPFPGCHNLTAIETSPDHPAFMSIDGVLFDRTMTTLLRFPSGKGGTYRIPEGTTDLRRAFHQCARLTSVVFPTTLNKLYEYAFVECPRLESVIFLGKRPGSLGWGDPFTQMAPDFTIYYLSSHTGFPSPTWDGYPTAVLDEVQYPAAPWLIAHGLPPNTDLKQDLNGDGDSLLLTYALDRDPNNPFHREPLTPMRDGDTLTLTFPAAAPGIAYTVETSTDLQHWTTEGVTLSELDPNQHRTASVPHQTPSRYLRLVVVSESP